MQRKLILLAACALAMLAACGSDNQSTSHQIQSDPAPVVATNVRPTISPSQAALPPVHTLDTIKATSQLFNTLTILAQSGATVDGSGHLIMDAPAGGFAWVVFDLGLQVPGFSIGSVAFTNADWTALNPAPRVFVGVADYTSNIWRFRPSPLDGTAANFNSLPPGVDFLSPTAHSYLAVVCDTASLDFGNDIDIQGTAAPGGELPADYTVDFPTMPGKFGQNNAIVIRPDGSGGDIATYCADNNGGALVRFTYDGGSDAISTTVKTLFDAGNAEALANCTHYRLDYYTAGPRQDCLGIGAARQAPNAIRQVTEDLPAGSFTFNPPFAYQTAVDNSVLPVSFADPQFDYKINATGDPQCVFKTQPGNLGYAYYVAGSWGIDTGGPALLGNIALQLTATDAIIAYQVSSGPDTKVVVRKMLQRPAGVDFGSAADAYFTLGHTAGDDVALALGLASSIHIANFDKNGAGTNALGFAYSDNGVIADTWDNAVADDGAGGTANVGESPSLGILTDGTPVVAYYDQTNKSLRLAISTTPDGGNITGATWDSYRIDTSQFGSEVGRWPALGVIKRTAPDPDKIIVAYGVVDGATTVMRIILLDAPARAT
jgi:hypothetical protein